MNQEQKEDIVHYYDICESDYRWFWDLNDSHAMHAGYWDDQTRSLRDALRRENEVLAKIADIQQGEHVLDAGCGVGGSTIFLAQNYACQVTGITLSAKQAKTAELKAAQAGVQANFQVMDYLHTSFPDHTFDVVWAIESVCHAPNKQLFIREAMRILKPQGRLIVADGFLKKEHACCKMESWLKGWGVQALEQVTVFENHLKEEGYKQIQFYDITPHVIPSSRRLYCLSWPAIPLSKIGEWLKWRLPTQTAHLYSARYQYQTLKKGLWCYGVFCAKKN